MELDTGRVGIPVPGFTDPVPGRDAELEVAPVPITEAELEGTLPVPTGTELLLELRLAAVPTIEFEGTLLEAGETDPELDAMIEPVPEALLGAVPIADVEADPVAVTEFDKALPENERNLLGQIGSYCVRLVGRYTKILTAVSASKGD